MGGRRNPGSTVGNAVPDNGTLGNVQTSMSPSFRPQYPYNPPNLGQQWGQSGGQYGGGINYAGGSPTFNERGGTMAGSVGPSGQANISGALGQMMPGIAGRMGQEQGQQNPLFQGMDPRLMQLFQKYGVNPTGTGTGNSDIAYWNQKMAAPGADQAYYLDRLEKDFQGTGMDVGNNNLSYGGQGNLMQKYYQQPMARGFQRGQGGRGRWGFGGSPKQGYQNNPQNSYGVQMPQYNYQTIGTPRTKKDTSEHPE
jgi:hypothetical protein